jgi:hypothetical protein
MFHLVNTNRYISLVAAQLVNYIFWCSLGEIYSDLTLNLTNILYIICCTIERANISIIMFKIWLYSIEDAYYQINVRMNANYIFHNEAKCKDNFDYHTKY